MTPESYTINTVDADDMVTLEARASTAIFTRKTQHQQS